MVGGEGVAVEIWLVPTAPVDDGALSREERRRADRFRRPADRATYVSAHSALRLLVGARLGVSPTAVRFGHEDCPLCGGPHGRPTLAGAAGAACEAGEAGDVPGREGAPIAPARPGPHGADPPLAFSLSRTAGLAAVALSAAVVGVDVETTDRPVALDDLTVALHRAELPVPDRRAALRRWVRKEAYLKGLGTGLGVEPATVDLSEDPPGWQIVDVPAAAGALCAVAVRSTAPVALTVTTATTTELADLLAAGGTVGTRNP